MQEKISSYNTSLRMSHEGAHALQKAAEAFLVGLFEDATRCANHAGRVTVQAKDMYLARLLSRQEDFPEFQNLVSTDRVCQGIRGLGGVNPVRPIRPRKRRVKAITQPVPASLPVAAP